MCDSSILGRQIQLGAIKDAISCGALDAQSINIALLAEVSYELNKPLEEVDMFFVNTCEELLAMVNRNRAASVESHYSSNLHAIHRKLKANEPRFPFASISFRLSVSLCLSVFLIFGGLLLSTGHLKTILSPDGEQLIIQGVQQPESAQTLADESSCNYGILTTVSYSEAAMRYGVPIHMPKWLPEGWEATLYSVDVLPAYARLTVTYQYAQSNANLTYTEKNYEDVALLRLEMEQNNKGDQFVMDDGTTVYISQNFDLITAQWQIDHSLCTLYGAISRDDALRSIRSIAP